MQRGSREFREKNNPIKGVSLNMLARIKKKKKVLHFDFLPRCHIVWWRPGSDKGDKHSPSCSALALVPGNVQSTDHLFAEKSKLSRGKAKC